MSTCSEWVEDMLTAAEGSGDARAVRLLERCGKGCAARQGATEGILKLRASALEAGCETRADYAAFLDSALSVSVGEAPDGIVMHLGKDACSCPMAAELGRASGALCECTRGHEVAVWGAFFGRPVDVEIVESLLRGGSDCVTKIKF